MGSKIQELEKTMVYVVASWWPPPIINIPSLKEKAIHLHNQDLAQETVLETLLYTEVNGISIKIGSSGIIWGIV